MALVFADGALAQEVPLPAYNATMPAVPQAAGSEYGANNSTGSTMLEEVHFQPRKGNTNNATVAMEVGADGEVRDFDVDPVPAASNATASVPVSAQAEGHGKPKSAFCNAIDAAAAKGGARAPASGSCPFN